MSAGAADNERKTFNIGSDAMGRPIFITRFGDRWKLRVPCKENGVQQVELTAEQIRTIAQVAKA